MGKISSRKLWVWVVWTILVGVSFIITKTIDANIISWYGTVSIVYIGGNTASKFITKEHKDG
jgi:hypothetical protein